MCGIAGVVSLEKKERLDQHVALQSHRGPDSDGSWVGSIGKSHIQFYHQRLSILDLSEAGSQPFFSPSGHILIFNGEIYNYIELRDKLKQQGLCFHTDCDTEVLSLALETWGVSKTLSLLNGMWAFAWIDQTSQKMFLCRDIMGEKPLYYALKNGAFYFASEIKALRAMCQNDFVPNDRVIHDFLSTSLINLSAETFYHGIDSLPAAHLLELNLNAHPFKATPQSYWSPDLRPVSLSYPQAVEQLKHLLDRAVKIRLRSDVPVGALLSGGIDSSGIVALARKYTSQLNLLSSVSPGSAYDESGFIDQVVSHTGLPIHKVNVALRADSLIQLLHQVIYFHDAPISNFSVAAHFELMRKAKDLGITVLLSGQGSDELFCGYRKYLAFYLQMLKRERSYFTASKVLMEFLFNRSILPQFQLSEAKRFISTMPASYLGERLENYRKPHIGLMPSENLNERQYRDLTQTSVPTITHYEDRMSMAHGREIRLPFLDRDVIEFALSLPTEFKLRRGWTKAVLRDALANDLPPAITRRRDKQAFVTPQADWLRGDLRAEVLDILNPDARVFREKYLHYDSFRKRYQSFCDHQAGTSPKDIILPLSLEIWFQGQGKHTS